MLALSVFAKGALLVAPTFIIRKAVAQSGGIPASQIEYCTVSNPK